MRTSIVMLAALLGAAPALAQDTGDSPTMERPDEEAAEEEAVEEAADEGAAAEEGGIAQPRPAPAPDGRLRDPGAGPGFFVGWHAGPAFAISPLSAAFLPRLELGIELPFVQRRIRVFGTGQWSLPMHQGTASDDRVPDGSWRHDLKQDQWMVGGGVSVALVEPGSLVVTPEVGVGALAFLQRSRINGSAGGAEFPESTEYTFRGGPLVQAGVRYRLGPGELVGHLNWHTADLNGVVTGDSTAMQIFPTVGFRLVF